MIDFDPTEEIVGIKWDHTYKRERLTSKEIEAIKLAPFKDGEVKKAVASISHPVLGELIC